MNNNIENPEKDGYYLVKTKEKIWGIFLWEGNKWWFDEEQNGRLKFGIKDGYVKRWYSLEAFEKDVFAVFKFPNGMVATTGFDGEQIPELQGRYTKELEEKIRLRADKKTQWNGF